MRKLLSVILVSVLLILSFGISASAVCSYEFSAETGTLTVGGTGVITSSFLSSSYDIGNYADVKSVIIKNGISAIEAFAFSDCVNLKSITMSSSVQLIDYSAFEDCSSIEEIFYTGSRAEWEHLWHENMMCAEFSGASVYFDCVIKAESHLEISSMPFKTTYRCSESFDSTGLIVNLVTDNTEVSVDGYELSYDFSVTGNQNVTVSYIKDGIVLKAYIPVKVVSDNVPVFSVNVIEENNTSAVVGISLEAGCFETVDFHLMPSGGKIRRCIGMHQSEDFSDFLQNIKDCGGQAASAYYFGTGYFSVAMTEEYSVTGQNFILYEYVKSSPDRLTEDDLSLDILYCTDDIGEAQADVEYRFFAPPEGHEHSYVPAETVNPDCENDGYIKYRCSCGESYKEIIPAVGHNYIHMVSQNSTCGQISTEFDFCLVCGKIINRTESVTQHSWSEWKITEYPSMTHNGVCTRHCSLCGASETDYLEYPLKNCVAYGGLVYGFRVGMKTDELVSEYVSAEKAAVKVTPDSGKIGTGSVITAVYPNGVSVKYTVVIFGDVTGDGKYDGQDAMLVNCIACGMLTRETAGEAAFTAADCNHDGVIDSLDVDILNQAGVLLAKIDQTKSEEELLETSSEYAQYLELIDQCEPDTDVLKREENIFDFIFMLLTALFVGIKEFILSF